MENYNLEPIWFYHIQTQELTFNKDFYLILLLYFYLLMRLYKIRCKFIFILNIEAYFIEYFLWN